MQGFNMGRYMPPASLDSSLATTNQARFNEGTCKKLGPGGAQTVRFEMPYAIWCTTCQPETIIAQGIRFNAEKKKVGNYFSTPIWSFRMKHGACGGTIEIRTDPETRDYAVTQGARRREVAAALSEGAFGEILTDAERERRRNDAFAQLEGRKQETKAARTENDRVQDLLLDSQTLWEDTYTMNQRLRKSFRADRKVREAKDKQKNDISERYGLALELLGTSETDAARASLVDFQSDPGSIMGSEAFQQPLFRSTYSTSRNLVSPQAQAISKAKAIPKSAQLHAIISSNTRTALDPFLGGASLPSTERFQLKRKRDVPMEDPVQTLHLARPTAELSAAVIATPTNGRPLIAYDSDTD